MDPKKRSRPPTLDDDGGGNRSRQLKRWRSTISLAWHMEIVRRCVELFVRRVVREELEKKLAGITRPLPRLLDTGNVNTRYQLQFPNNLLEEEFYTFYQKHIEVAIVDTYQKKIVKTGPLSTVKVGIYVLHGDSCNISWTEKDVAHERNDKESLLKGQKVIKLKDGAGSFDISITDISKWARKQRFRLGAKLVTTNNTHPAVQGGISEPFLVRDRRTKYNKNKKSSSVTLSGMKLKGTVADKFPKLLQTQTSLTQESNSSAPKESADEAVNCMLQQHHLATYTNVDNLPPEQEPLDVHGLPWAKECSSFQESDSSTPSLVNRHDFPQSNPSNASDPSSSLGKAQIHGLFGYGETLAATARVEMMHVNNLVEQSSHYVEKNHLITNNIGIGETAIQVMPEEGVKSLIFELCQQKSMWYKPLLTIALSRQMLAASKKKKKCILRGS